jgi:hypothetical protein
MFPLWLLGLAYVVWYGISGKRRKMSPWLWMPIGAVAYCLVGVGVWLLLIFVLVLPLSKISESTTLALAPWITVLMIGLAVYLTTLLHGPLVRRMTDDDTT